MTAVTVMLIRLITAVEITGVNRALSGDDFRFFFVAAMISPKGVRLMQPDPDASLSSSTRSWGIPSHPSAMKMLKLSSQSNLTNVNGLQMSSPECARRRTFAAKRFRHCRRSCY